MKYKFIFKFKETIKAKRAIPYIVLNSLLIMQ